MPQPLIDAAALARHLGVARSFVYDHADRLGAIIATRGTVNLKPFSRNAKT